MRSLIVIVSGPPGAGKTTLVREFAPRLRLPLLSKDDIKESLGDSFGKRGLRWSKRLGAASWEVMFCLASRFTADGASFIWEANFYPGVHRERVAALGSPTFEVHVTASIDVLRHRAARRVRHPVHHRLPILRAENGPLELSEHLVRLDTTDGQPVDLDPIVSEIRRVAGWTSTR